MARSSIIRILCITLALCIFMPISSATVYTVGDAGGWGLGNDYSTWASDKTFVVGDSLVFKYDSSHSVAEVPSDDYNACSSANAVSSENSGDTTIQLKTAGTHYYVCGVSFHCSSGMKMAISVKPSGSATTPATPSSSSGGTTTPSTPSITTPTTSSHLPSSSSKPVLSAFVALFLASFGFYALVMS